MFIEGYNPEGGGGGSHDNTGRKRRRWRWQRGLCKKGFYINSISYPVQVVVGAGGARGVDRKETELLADLEELLYPNMEFINCEKPN